MLYARVVFPETSTVSQKYNLSSSPESPELPKMWGPGVRSRSIILPNWVAHVFVMKTQPPFHLSPHRGASIVYGKWVCGNNAMGGGGRVRSLVNFDEVKLFYQFETPRHTWSLGLKCHSKAKQIKLALQCLQSTSDFLLFEVWLNLLFLLVFDCLNIRKRATSKLYLLEKWRNKLFT